MPEPITAANSPALQALYQPVSPPQPDAPAGQPMVLVGVQISFWDLVKLLIKVGLAAVPACIVVSLALTVMYLWFWGSMILGLLKR